MKKYDHQKIEKKWQKKWANKGLYKTSIDSNKPECYVLDMFPYPSGEGLHVGHPKGYIATDIYSRFKKMSGFEVLHPMGWDAFGLPAENFAIKNKVHPRVAVEQNIQNFKNQLSKLGFNYDWSREINTTDPEYYKWTQWIFLQLFKKGLAFESHEPINWCPSCQTGLANEDLENDGTCERCGSVVEKKPMRQWVLRITDYADRLLDDLSLLTKWPEHIKESQRNWIGKSEGAEISFKLIANNLKLKETINVFTTRPDTLFGATYVVLSPENPLVVTGLLSVLENKKEVEKYIEESGGKAEMDRLDDTKEKTGVELKGVEAINPANEEEIPIYIADYVLANYGTGAIMAVPGHDERDFEFAKKFNLPLRQVIAPRLIQTVEPGAFRSGETMVFRDGIIALVKHWKDNKYIALKWKEVEWGTLLTGGIEDAENAEQTVLKEIREETGFLNAKIVRNMGVVDGMFYHVPKKENRTVHGHMFYVELQDDIQENIAHEEAAKHDIEWLTLDELKSFLTAPTHHHAVDVFEMGDRPYTGNGNLINSEDFSNMESSKAKRKITEFVGGKMTSTYRLNDWVFSRQRYWGEPIPIIHCEKCGPVAVPEADLPVLLPDVENYEPTGTGESPLANIDEWVNTTCPECDGEGKRETNTMPQWAGSSWYYLRFIDPKNEINFVDAKLEKKWVPVDVYVGGDHAVRHLIYARFWHKFLYDEGLVSTKEPFERLEFLGFILAEDGRKMSKRWGNVINPDEVVKTNGADALRVYEMFMSPFENTTAWNTDGLVGAQRFLERVWKLSESFSEESSPETTRELHKTIQKVGNDIEGFKFNTAISQMMIFLNTASEHGITKGEYKTFIQFLAPFAPHITEELWNEVLQETNSIHTQEWPKYDVKFIEEKNVIIAVQIDGKTRGKVNVPKDSTEAFVLAVLAKEEGLKKWLGNVPKRVVFVENRLINIVF